jgi:hypothetical protein
VTWCTCDVPLQHLPLNVWQLHPVFIMNRMVVYDCGSLFVQWLEHVLQDPAQPAEQS